MLRRIGVFCISVSAAVMFACGVDSPTSPVSSKDTSNVALPGNPEAPPASPDETTEPLGITSDALITPNTCSVTLNFCDRPNSSIGTDCTESGCTLDQAISACESIVSSVGCVQHCNAVMRNSAGTIIDTWRIQCGGVCCPVAPQGFCGPSGQCCDGIHCGGGCPC